MKEIIIPVRIEQSNGQTTLVIPVTTYCRICQGLGYIDDGDKTYDCYACERDKETLCHHFGELLDLIRKYA